MNCILSQHLIATSQHTNVQQRSSRETSPEKEKAGHVKNELEIGQKTLSYCFTPQF